MRKPLFIWSPGRRTSSEKKIAQSSHAYSMSSFDAMRKKLWYMNVRATITDTAKINIATNSMRHTFFFMNSSVRKRFGTSQRTSTLLSMPASSIYSSTNTLRPATIGPRHCE